MTGSACEGTSRAARAGRRLAGIAAILLALATAGCTSVPDWANPIAWAEDAFSDDELPPIETSAGVVERLEPRRERAEEKAYPSLATVPERPAAITSPEERRAIIEGLIADRAGADHAGRAAADEQASRTAPQNRP